ncbi:MAG: ATP-binding cassette domain-containing protein, partial [Clostridia bacterium]|nr:ATP-binding cassette domain-containing protein [Clostridia bacterium]
MALEVEIKKKLKGFTLDIAFSSEQKLGVLGSSGCGKSMTLKCIAGVIRPDSGRIVLNGRVLFDSRRGIDLRPQQRRVGYLFQNYALFPHMTVMENIACGRGIPAKEALHDSRIKEVIRLLRLQGLEERYPLQLSGGQQQRVALARILVSQPEIVLLDEPFSALDEYLREQLQLQMAEILDQWGENVILVTHNRDEVYRLSERLAVMEGGRIIGEGGTRTLFARPQRTQIARLTGCKNI